MKPKEPKPVIFAKEDLPIKWRKPGEGTFFFVESKEPDGFRVSCVTSEGKLANLVPTIIRERSFPSGEFFQARAWKDGQPVQSPFYESVGIAKNACEQFRRDGKFPDRETST